MSANNVVPMVSPHRSFRAREELIRAMRRWMIEMDRDIADGAMEWDELTEAEMQLYKKAKNFFG